VPEAFLIENEIYSLESVKSLRFICDRFSIFMPSLRFRIAVLAISALPLANQMVASEAKEPTPVFIRFENHRFTPRKLTVPAGKPVLLRVVNASRERIEFESFRLNREEVVPPGATILLRLPALRSGSYDFYDDFHADVPEGVLVAG
jgi:hypothetical protein